MQRGTKADAARGTAFCHPEGLDLWKRLRPYGLTERFRPVEMEVSTSTMVVEQAQAGLRQGFRWLGEIVHRTIGVGPGKYQIDLLGRTPTERYGTVVLAGATASVEEAASSKPPTARASASSGGVEGETSGAPAPTSRETLLISPLSPLRE